MRLQRRGFHRLASSIVIRAACASFGAHGSVLFCVSQVGPRTVIVDSISTVYLDNVDSSAGRPNQARLWAILCLSPPSAATRALLSLGAGGMCAWRHRDPSKK